MEEARLLYEESTSLSVMNNVDEPETWKEKKNRIQASSEYGHLEGWTLVSVIAKSFDDMRQEVFAQQLIVLLKEIFDAENAPLYLRPYR
jgi:phosphatidylinositol 4-kinase